MKIINYEKIRKAREVEAQIETQKLKDEITEARLRIEYTRAEMDRLHEIQMSYQNIDKIRTAQ